ncbi:hypothetical protein FUA23_10880 [Neolewinella aurantiaca]|uniref:Antitoxin component YwqK of YwqJK toxin-antitoxin module n=1 Tax=Neolewinella aurantiaca TaxID=2602767 RepID=A0A5C7FS49_9BACT|nr:hypothetical protein [Neolewinella aurantiaca]TXF89247.1 hypothetical protein FUA23_10880 [Neolewinella aurantiaca]
MNRFLLSLLLLASCLSIVVAQVNPNYHSVRGYTRKDGTRVQGYKRTNPNSTVNDNYSTRGNINPWTGQAGTVPRDDGRVTAPTNYYSTTTTRSYSYDDRQRASKASDRKITYSDGTEHFTITYNKLTSWDREKTYYAYGGQSQGLVSGKGYVSGLLLDGKYAMRYNNGRTLVESNFQKGLLHGQRIGYDQGGKLVLKEKYYEGELIEQSDFEGNTETTYFWKVGQIDNPKIEVREYGKIQMEIETRFGKEIVSYYDDGSQYPTRKVSFEDGQANGAFEWYYPGTKKIMKTGSYADNELDGEVVEFNEQGDRETLFTYSKGVKNGEFVLYEKGNPFEKGRYENGAQVGSSTVYNSDGSIKAELDYITPEVASYKLYEDGKLTEEGQFINQNKHGEVKLYDGENLIRKVSYQNGKMTGQAIIYQEPGYIKAAYIDGKEDGRWTLYRTSDNNNEGYPIAYSTYRRGVLDGPFWTLKGDTVRVGFNSEGLRHGRFTAYLSASSLVAGIHSSIVDGPPKMKIEEGEYVRGKREGQWKFYSLGNMLLKEAFYREGELHGKVIDYYPNWADDNGDKLPYAGELRQISTYDHGEKTGPATTFSFLDKVPEPCKEEGSDDCFSYRWVKDRCEFGYRNGEYHGPMTIVAENGDTIRKATFSNGQLQGSHYSLTENAAIWSNFLNGKEHGRFKIIDYDANTVSSGLMQFGEAVGIWETRLAVEGKDNLLSTTRFSDTGKLETGYDFSEGFKKYEAQYLDGHLKSITQFDRREKITATYSFQVEDSTVVVFTHLFGEEEVVYTKRVNEVVKLMMIPDYFIDNWAESPVNLAGILHGQQRFRDTRGKVMYERTYNSGRLDGTALEVSGSEEELIRKAVYDNGVLVGENFFDVKTKKLAKGKFLIKDENGLFQKVRLKDGVRQ